MSVMCTQAVSPAGWNIRTVFHPVIVPARYTVSALGCELSLHQVADDIPAQRAAHLKTACTEAGLDCPTVVSSVAARARPPPDQRSPNGTAGPDPASHSRAGGTENTAGGESDSRPPSAPLSTSITWPLPGLSCGSGGGAGWGGGAGAACWLPISTVTAAAGEQSSHCLHCPVSSLPQTDLSAQRTLAKYPPLQTFI